MMTGFKRKEIPISRRLINLGIWKHLTISCVEVLQLHFAITSKYSFIAVLINRVESASLVLAGRASAARLRDHLQLKRALPAASHCCPGDFIRGCTQESFHPQ